MCLLFVPEHAVFESQRLTLDVVQPISRYALKLSTNGTWQCSASPDLALTVWCDPPGHGSSSTTCGSNSFFEPLVLAQSDSFTAQYKTQVFAFDAQTHEITLNKSGHCVSVSGSSIVPGSQLGLSDCSTGSTLEWSINSTGFIELIQDGQQSGLCLGMAGPKTAEHVFTIDRPFSVPLDSTSMITILPFQGRLAFNGNDYSDGGEGKYI